MDDFKMSNKGKPIMLENPEGTERYEFFTWPIQKSNVDSSIAYYEPCVKHCKLLTLGSTSSMEHTSITKGNELYKKLIMKGWHKVTFKTQSFA